MKNSSRKIYFEFCKKHGVTPTLKGIKKWSQICK